MEYLLLLIVVAVLGNLIIRKVVARVDREPAVPETMATESKKLASVNPQEVLKAWGRVAENPDVQIAGPLHPSIAAYLRRYELVAPDKFLKVLDRSLAAHPFKENNAFTQIGVWSNGSEVLVRRDASDARVYLADVEDATPEQPEVLAQSFEQYLREAWLHDLDSQE